MAKSGLLGMTVRAGQAKGSTSINVRETLATARIDPVASLWF